MGGLVTRVNRLDCRACKTPAGGPLGLIRPDTNTFVSSTARGLTATPDLAQTLQDVSLQLSLVGIPVLVPYFLDGFPGIVLLQLRSP